MTGLPWPRLFRILILSSTSPVYNALWYWPLMSLRISAEWPNRNENSLILIWPLSKISHNLHLQLIVPCIQQCALMKTLHTNLCHFAKFLKISSDEVEERQLVKVLCSLVCHFHNLLTRMEKMIYWKLQTFVSGNKNMQDFNAQCKTNIEAWRPSVLWANIPGE